MVDNPDKAHSWWLTLPGVLTAVAGLITAITGLLVGLNQAGLLGSHDSATTATATATATSAPTAPATATLGPNADSGHAAASGTYRVDAPLGTPFPGDDVTYTLISVAAIPDVDGSMRIDLEVRASNEDRYGLNFWDDTFRLQVGDNIYAPVSGLNELVPGDSTKTGKLSFVVPDDTKAAQLAIAFQSGTKSVPVTVSRAKAGE
jgi:hypothetical protein